MRANAPSDELEALREARRVRDDMSIPTMPWGKFRGVPLNQIDTDYLRWVVDVAEATRPGLRADVEAELARRRQTHAPPSPFWRKPCPDVAVAHEIVTTGQRTLAKRHHPDVGGSTGLMQRINAVADWLKAQVPQ